MALRHFSRCAILALAVGATAFAGLATAGPAPAPRASTEPRSPLIYRPERIALRMDHALPAHRALRCVRCHEGAGRSRLAADDLNPEESTCLPCHEAEMDRARPSVERCGTCHAGYGEDGVVPRSHFPTPRLHFSHAAHVRFGGMKCLSCHAGVDDVALGTRKHLPTMRSCMRCHGATAARAPSTCDTCHLSEPDGVLKTHFPEGHMNPKPWQFGMHHDADFIVRHRWVAADRGEDCASCHRPSDCVDCHDGRVHVDRVHSGDFLTTHSQMARRDDPQCTSCHATQSFCNECHARLGLSTISAPRARLGVRYHPSPEVWIRGPVQHGVEARRSMSTCTSCHVEDDCVDCHGAVGVGLGVSPHPPGFLAACGRALERNARACRTCHGDVAALRAVCR